MDLKRQKRKIGYYGHILFWSWGYKLFSYAYTIRLYKIPEYRIKGKIVTIQHSTSECYTMSMLLCYDFVKCCPSLFCNFSTSFTKVAIIIWANSLNRFEAIPINKTAIACIFYFHFAFSNSLASFTVYTCVRTRRIISKAIY